MSMFKTKKKFWLLGMLCVVLVATAALLMIACNREPGADCPDASTTDYRYGQGAPLPGKMWIYKDGGELYVKAVAQQHGTGCVAVINAAPLYPAEWDAVIGALNTGGSDAALALLDAEDWRSWDDLGVDFGFDELQRSHLMGTCYADLVQSQPIAGCPIYESCDALTVNNMVWHESVTCPGGQGLCQAWETDVLFMFLVPM